MPFARCSRVKENAGICECTAVGVLPVWCHKTTEENGWSLGLLHTQWAANGEDMAIKVTFKRLFFVCSSPTFASRRSCSSLRFGWNKWLFTSPHDGLISMKWRCTYTLMWAVCSLRSRKWVLIYSCAGWHSKLHKVNSSAAIISLQLAPFVCAIYVLFFPPQVCVTVTKIELNRESGWWGHAIKSSNVITFLTLFDVDF